MNPLSAFQINPTEAIQLCTNLDCFQYANRLEKFNISSCVINRDFTQARLNEQQNREAQFDQLVQKLIQTEKELLSEERYKNLGANLNRSASNQASLIQHEQLIESFDFNTQINVAYPPSIDKIEQTTTSPALDEDFMLELDNYLNSDGLDLTLTSYPLVTDSTLTTNSNQMTPMDLYDTASNSYANLENILLCSAQDELSLDAASSNQGNENLASTLLDATANDASQLENGMELSCIMPEFDTDGNKVIAYGKSSSGKSSIMISKIKKSATVETKVKSKVGRQKFEIIEDGEDIMELISQQEKSKKVKPVEKMEVSKPAVAAASIFMPKPANDRLLLPWEVKNKSNARKKASDVGNDGAKSPIKSFSTASSKSFGFSSSPKASLGSITKADLSQKVKASEQKSGVKGGATFLKDILMKDNSFLSNLTSTSLNQSLNGSSSGGGGGYKDLVLNVLEKKTTA